jgi:Na+-driven multidrug efflux pump
VDECKPLVVGAGVLRGAGRLGAALVADVVGFWVFGIPAGCYLALGQGRADIARRVMSCHYFIQCNLIGTFCSTRHRITS